MDINEIKQIKLVEFLNQLGYQPTGRDSRGLWYLSPIRSERKPSFHVNPQKNVWYDFGEGKGGDIFTLAGELCGSADFIKQADFIAEKMRMPMVKPIKPQVYKREPSFEDVQVFELTNRFLLAYLRERGIKPEIAKAHCDEVHYKLNGKPYYAIGFKNVNGGFELRNRWFKGSIHPKDISLIPGNSTCNVYEGFIDFLSAVQLGLQTNESTIVLNSVGNLQKAFRHLDNYLYINAYMDNDEAGQNALKALVAKCGSKVFDCSKSYPDHKDLNDYLVSITPKKQNKLKF